MLGRFAVDFVVVRDDAGDWTPYAIELNLRKGGTTHPFLTLQFLTDGRYDAATGLFLHPGAVPRSTWWPPTTSSRRCAARRCSVDDLFDIVARHGLHFDQSRQAGVVFHMISSLTEHGRIGLTAVGDTPAEARTGATGRPRRSCSTRPRWHSQTGRGSAETAVTPGPSGQRVVVAVAAAAAASGRPAP